MDDDLGRRAGAGWYPFVVALVVALLLGAVALWQLPGLFGGDVGQRLGPGEPVTVRTGPTGQDGPMVWVRTDDPDPVRLDCDLTPLDGQAPEETVVEYPRAGGLPAVQRDGWHALVRLHAEPAGRYAVTCTAGDPALALSIGSAPYWYDARSVGLARFGALALGALGLGGGVLLVVVRVAGRRPAPAA